MRGRFLEISLDTKIYYRHHQGSLAHPLIFIHGLGGNLTAWTKSRNFFQRLGFTTYALDLRGHGLSSKKDGLDYYALNHFAADIHSFITKLKIKDPVIIGHSFGGIVSILHAALYPNDLSALILIDANSKPPFFAKKTHSYAFFTHLHSLLSPFLPVIHRRRLNYQQFTRTADWDLHRIALDIIHTTFQSYLNICEQLTSYNATRLLDKITVPTLVITGTDDSIFPPSTAYKLAARIKAATLDVIPHANHILVLNNPDSLNHSLLNFLTSLGFAPPLTKKA